MGNVLTLGGSGQLQNTNALNLSGANGKLKLSSITVDSVSTSADSSGLDVDEDSAITSLQVRNITPVAIADGRSLSGGITVTGGSLQLAETGTLASAISMSGGSSGCR